MGRIRILISGVSIVIALAFYVTYWIVSEEDSYADEIISTTSNSFSSSLDNFLNSVNQSVDILVSSTQEIENGIPEVKEFNEVYSKMINNDKYLVGIALSNEKFSYIIYKDNSTWASTMDGNMLDSVSNWTRLNNELEVVSEWTDVATSFPTKNSVELIKQKLQTSKYVWNVNNNPIPETPNIISVVFNSKNSAGENILVGLIYNSLDLSRDFASVLKYDKPLITILTTDNKTVTPIITTDTSSIKLYKTLEIQIREIVTNWGNQDNLSSQSFSFEKQNSIYWTRVMALGPKIGVKGFAVTISAKDLAMTEENKERRYLYIAILFSLFAIIFFVFRKSKRQVSTIEKTEFQIPSSEELLEIINKGETEFVEFKSSLRWDYREEVVNKILENVILKSINAFANAKGGSLIIGVDDDMNILGLENDFNTLKKKDADYFELHLRKLINNQYGIAFSNENLSMTFHNYDGKTICLIQVKASDTPIFLKTKNKQGAEIEKFYVRSGNASQEIASLTEINEYINVRFDK